MYTYILRRHAHPALALQVSMLQGMLAAPST